MLDRVSAVYRRKSILALIVILLSICVSITYGFKDPVPTNAAATDTVNFQARLESADGAIVPDGNYNVEFKLYTGSSGGTALWTEDYLNSASEGVRVSNGYLTANLGSITAFPSTIPWSQQLYLGMNIGGTTSGSPSWDGEMTPRLLLTAVPYAFQAQNATQLQTTSGSNTATLSFTTPSANDNITLPDASGTVCLDSSSACGFASSSGSGSYIQNTQATNTLQTSANFYIQSAGNTSITATIQALSSQTADLLRFENSAGSAALSGINSSGQLYYQSGSYTGTLAQTTLTSGNAVYDLPNVTGTQTICTIQSGNCAGSGNGITGSGTPDYVALFNTTSTITSSDIYDDGTSVGINTTDDNGQLTIGTPLDEPGLFIEGYSPVRLPSSIPTVVVEEGSSQTADLIDFDDSSSDVLASIDSSGDLTADSGTFSGGLFVSSPSSLDTVTYIPSSTDNNSLVCQNSVGQLADCSTAILTGNAFVNNGNTFGATGLLGTTDNNPLELEGHGNVGLTVTTAGDVGVGTTSSLNSGTLSVQGQSGQVAEVLRGASSQDIADFYTSTPTKVASIDSNGQINSTLSSSSSLTNLTLNSTNANTTSTAITSNGASIALTGTTNSHSLANTLNGINFANVTAIANNAFNGLYFGTGYTSLLNYNGNSLVNGSGLLQNAAIGSSTNYSNLTEVGALTSGSIASGFGTISTGNNITTSTAVSGGTYTNAGNTFNVNSLGYLTLGGSSTTGELLLDSNASGSNSIVLEAASPSTAQTITFPNATGTVCLSSSSNCGSFTGSSGVFVQNGNAFGATAVLGTTDNNPLELEAHGTVGLTVSTAGNLSSSGTYNTDTLSSSALTFGAASTASIQSASSQALTISAGSGNSAATLNSTGGGALTLDSTGTGTVNLGTGSSAKTINVGTNTSGADAINVGSTDSSTAITLQGGSSSVVVNNNGTAVTGLFSVTGYNTTNTSNTFNGEWTELGSCTITAQFNDCNTELDILAGASGSTTSIQAVLTWRVKQQAALGSAPLVQTVMDNEEFITDGNIVSVTTTNNSSQTVVQLWAQDNQTFDIWHFTPYLENNSGTAALAWLSNNGFSASLPAGTQTATQYDDVNANTLAVVGSSTLSGGLTVTGGTVNLNVASGSNYGTNINTSSGSGTVAIGNSTSTVTLLGTLNLNNSGSDATNLGNTGSLTVKGSTASSIAFGSSGSYTLKVAASTGIITTLGNTSSGETPIITTNNTTGTGAGDLVIEPGSASCSGAACSGNDLYLLSGDNSGSYSGCHITCQNAPGNVYIDTGQGNSQTEDAEINIGTTYAGQINLGTVSNITQVDGYLDVNGQLTDNSQLNAEDGEYATIASGVALTVQAGSSGDIQDWDASGGGVLDKIGNGGFFYTGDIESITSSTLLIGDYVNSGALDTPTITIGDNSSSASGDTQTVDLGYLQAAGTTNVNIGATASATAGTTTIDGKTSITLVGPTNINTSGSSTINVGTSSYSGTLTLGNSSATNVIAGNSSSTITFGNFTVNSTGNVKYAAGTASNDTLVCQNSSGQLASCSTTGSSGIPYIQGGNNFGSSTVGVLGTTSSDAGALELESDGNIGLTVTTAGNLTASGTYNSDTLTSSALTFGAASTAAIASASAQTLTINGGSSTGAVTIGNSSAGIITLQSGNTSQTISSSGDTIQTTTNSSTAYQIQNAGGSPILLVGTTNNNLISNPGFDVNTTGWTATGTGASISRNTTASNTYESIGSLGVTTGTVANSGAEATSFTTSPSGNNNYALSFYAMASTSNAFSDLSVTMTATGGTAPTCTLNSNNVLTTGFERYSCTFNPGTGVTVTGIIFGESAITSHVFYLDAVQLVTGSSITPYNIGNIDLRGVINNPISVESNSNSNTAFQIQNAAGTSNLLIADTIDNVIGVGLTPSASGAALQVSSGGISTTGTIQGGTVNATSSFQANGTAGLSIASCGAGYALTGSTFSDGIITGNGGCSSGSICTSATNDCGSEDGSSDSWIIGLNTPTTGSSGTECGASNFCTLGTANATTLMLQADNNTNVFLDGNCTAIAPGGSLAYSCYGVFSAGYNSTTLSATLSANSNNCISIDTTSCGPSYAFVVNSATTTGSNEILNVANNNCVAINDTGCASTDDFVVKDTGGTNALQVIDSTGCVAVSTSTCGNGEKLAVGGKIIASNTITASGSLDYAEYDTATNPSTINAADLVSNDPNNPGQIILSNGDYDANLIGVISTNPAFAANNNIDPSTGNTYTYLKPLALAGRVPVNVTGENGSIEPGDYITASETPGYGMKATEPGKVVGMALTSFSGTSISDQGQITMEVESFDYAPSVSTMLQGENQLTNISLSGQTNITGNLSIGDSNGGISISPSSTNPYEPILYGTARHHIGIVLSPQYSGAVIGSNNNGTIINGICQNSSSSGGLNIDTIPSINSCTSSGEGHTYYAWTTNQSTPQANDIYVRYQLPSNFSAWSTSNPVELSGWTTNHNNDSVSLSMYAPNGQQCGSSTSISTSDKQWQTTALGGYDGSNFANCDNLAAGNVVTLQIHLTSSTDDYALAGDLAINYLSSY